MSQPAPHTQTLLETKEQQALTAWDPVTSFDTSVAAEFGIFGGSIDDFAYRSKLSIKASGRGMKPTSGKTIFARTEFEIERSCRELDAALTPVANRLLTHYKLAQEVANNNEEGSKQAKTAKAEMEVLLRTKQQSAQKNLFLLKHDPCITWYTINGNVRNTVILSINKQLKTKLDVNYEIFYMYVCFNDYFLFTVYIKRNDKYKRI